MKARGLFVVGALCGAAALAIPRAVGFLHTAVAKANNGEPPGVEARVHTREEFAFTAKGTIEQVAPLFGADKERVWAVDWNPRFLFPQPAMDTEGMVFTTDRHQGHAVWVNTQLDLKSARVQYVYVVPDRVATLITLSLIPVGDRTHVAVKYERTSLSADADEHVRRMAEGDRGSGSEWEKAVDAYLGKASR
jgi:hypothetical protein